LTYQAIDAAQAPAVVLGQIFKSNLLEEVLLPAPLTAVDADRHVSLFANGRAEATSVLSGSHLSQSVSQVVEVTLGEELRRHVVLEPQNLGHLHLNAHGATNVAEQVVFCSVDLFGLLDGTVVEPQDDVSVVAVCVVELGAGDTLRLAGFLVEDGEGAGGIEADAADGLWVDVVLVHCTLDGVADALPDVGDGLFLHTWLVGVQQYMGFAPRT